MHEGFGEIKITKGLMDHEEVVGYGEEEDHLKANPLDEEEYGEILDQEEEDHHKANEFDDEEEDGFII
ncbi:unnamed protein product [Linum trigynum]|uniref:Uncharacterized protein n=1 Tax=Linum trigynum TaxID=586398 RepID=A0AAV2CGQ9_9ROSI